jgi:hypothetical protein
MKPAPVKEVAPPVKPVSMKESPNPKPVKEVAPPMKPAPVKESPKPQKETPTETKELLPYGMRGLRNK